MVLSCPKQATVKNFWRSSLNNPSIVCEYPYFSSAIISDLKGALFWPYYLPRGSPLLVHHKTGLAIWMGGQPKWIIFKSDANHLKYRRLNTGKHNTMGRWLHINWAGSVISALSAARSNFSVISSPKKILLNRFRVNHHCVTSTILFIKGVDARRSTTIVDSIVSVLGVSPTQALRRLP